MDTVTIIKNTDDILDFINTINSEDRSKLLGMMDDNSIKEEGEAEIILLQLVDDEGILFVALIKDRIKQQIVLMTSESNFALSSLLSEVTGEPKEKFFENYGGKSSEI
jgi:hypothetical protein